MTQGRKSPRPGKPEANPIAAAVPNDTSLARMRRRRQAALRSTPLNCGCRDPFGCRCTEPPLSKQALDAWRHAAEHLLETGDTPIVPLEVLKCWWRNGGAGRQLAERLWTQTGGLVA